MKPAAVVFSGGIGHPFPQSAPVLGQLLTSVGFDVHVTCELESVIAAIERDPTALLVVYALRWGMTQHEKYAPDRAQWAFSIPDPARRKIETHVANGAGLMGLHTASICFDDWPQWGELLGGRWHWGQSFHPPLGTVTATLRADHPLAAGLQGFTLTDEAYSALEVSPAVQLVATVRAPDSTRDEPAIWTHRYGRGRVFYDSLGHDAESLGELTHARLLRRAALWVTGRTFGAQESI